MNPLKILIVDDSKQARLMVSRFVTKMGHAVVTARDGSEAVELFSAETPDLIVMDVHMPGMDGYEAARQIRQREDDTWVPIIFLSAGAEDEDQVKGLEIGGDDYLIKPVRFRVLEAKIKALWRVAELQHRVQEHAEQLAYYRDETEQEQQLAKHLMGRIIRADDIEDEQVQRWIHPAQHFSGDLIVAARTPGGVRHVLLADGTGHGLSAALSVMPVIETFYSMTETGFRIATIVRELNRKVKQLLPVERFVAVTLAAIDPMDGMLEVWNGGNPPCMLVSHTGRLLRSWRSSQPALGILDNDAFDDRTDAFQWPEPGWLYMCSDGLLEAENEAGEEFGIERLTQTLTRAPSGDAFTHCRNAVRRHLNSHPAHDDVSLIAVECPLAGQSMPVPSTRVESLQQSASVDSLHWKLALHLGSSELKRTDFLPFVMSWLEQADVSQAQREEIFLIVSELVNNALDHGVLALDSSLKSLPDGFEHYLQARADRLATLSQGFVEVDIERVGDEGCEFLHIRVKDSGRGFDQACITQSQDLTRNQSRAGRGIALVQSLCAALEYRAGGTEVVAEYRLS